MIFFFFFFSDNHTKFNELGDTTMTNILSSYLSPTRIVVYNHTSHPFMLKT